MHCICILSVNPAFVCNMKSLSFCVETDAHFSSSPVPSRLAACHGGGTMTSRPGLGLRNGRWLRASEMNRDGWSAASVGASHCPPWSCLQVWCHASLALHAFGVVVSSYFDAGARV